MSNSKWLPRFCLKPRFSENTEKDVRGPIMRRRQKPHQHNRVWPCEWGLDWTQSLKLSLSKSVKALLFTIHVKKVTVWTNRALRVARWLHQSGILEGFPLDRKSGGWGRRGRKKEKHIPAYTWEGWAMERCQHVLLTGNSLRFHLWSKWAACRVFSPLLLWPAE